MTFRKRIAQGKTLLQPRGFAGFPRAPLSENSHSVASQLDAPAHDKWEGFQFTLKILEFLPEGSGTGFLHKKRVPEIFPLPSRPWAKERS